MTFFAASLTYPENFPEMNKGSFLHWIWVKLTVPELYGGYLMVLGWTKINILQNIIAFHKDNCLKLKFISGEKVHI